MPEHSQGYGFHNQKKENYTKITSKSLSFEDWDFIWTKLNYADLSGDVLQIEITAAFKPWQISIYMILLHQQFCSFSQDA